MTKIAHLINLFDTYGLRRLLEKEYNKSFNETEVNRFKYWLNDEFMKDTNKLNPQKWLKDNVVRYSP